MDTRVRKMLIESARQNRPLVYSDVMRKIRLDHSDQDDRSKFSKILEDISRFEHSKKRPMLSAQIIYKGSGDIGKKFYWLAKELKYGTQRELEESIFEIEMMKRCHSFWTDENNFRVFFNDDGEGFKAVPSSSDILNQTPMPAATTHINGKQVLSFAGHDVDWMELTEVNIKLGNAGEELVRAYEKEILQMAGLTELADKVAKVKDGLGYDILSFYADGREKYIEVKTTNGGSNAVFFITACEREFSRQKSEQYHLYRLYNFQPEKRPIDFFEVRGHLDNHLKLDAIVFRAQF